MKFINILFMLAFMILKGLNGDIPCAPRFYPNKSSVCVCNSTYCDTVTRDQPVPGTFISYTSSKSGLRFFKSWGYIKEKDSFKYANKHHRKVIELRPKKTYQTIKGFGGAVTDAAGINLKSLPSGAQQRLIESYCSDNGLEYNMLRVPIGSSDFSTHDYAYNEYPENDYNLTNFTLAPEDFNLKIPMIQACQKVAKEELHVVSAVWNSPLWMRSKKNTKSIDEKFYQPFADYHCRFAEKYKENGIKIWGLSASNEPLTNVEFTIRFTEMSWTAIKMAKFIVNNFGPTIKNCSVSGIQILANDDQRYNIPIMFTELTITDPNVMNYIDGIASHYYGDYFAPPSIASYALQPYPDKFIISTEASVGSFVTTKVDLGSWDRAKEYIMDILENLNYNYSAWIDWNLCLDEQGGPNWARNFVDSLIIVDAKKQEFLKQPMFYAFGHFTKFLPRGSRRIKVATLVPLPDPDQDLQDIELLRWKRFDHVAFMTPRRTIVVIIHNEGPAQVITILLDSQKVTVLLEEESITTVEIPYYTDLSDFETFH